MLASFKVYLDGENVGEIRNGRMFTYIVSEGPHVLQLRLDWTSSKPIQVDVHGTVDFICGPNSNWSSFFRAFYSPGDYLYLRLTDG